MQLHVHYWFCLLLPVGIRKHMCICAHLCSDAHSYSELWHVTALNVL